MSDDTPETKEKFKYKKWDFFIGVMMVVHSSFKIFLLFYKHQNFDWYAHGFSFLYLFFGSFLIYRYYRKQA
ncbi:hypothetical protein NBT05_13110 [Aquimarina sp. ERC-38]|uniref:hypothetical protein n=1 Tax=Aquimarina sp. ERC-38 TaxID=2949996 RepID=UPI00224700AD|nr:hypothetical protein [Aquimarina sp. ERC-38]UZO79883.1 hypothetical protein NBT05_13110 [Aquimarina sp. ERC-38]